MYYKATVVSKDTATILSVLDSIKTVMINAYDSTGPVNADALDSFTIVLSKNYGFTQVFDLYTFPYHAPDSSYRPGLDFFLDRSTCTPNDICLPGGYAPVLAVTIFKITDFINPNEQQIYNWNTGDIIQSSNETGVPIRGTVTHTDLTDTVTNKVLSGHYINYTVVGSTHACPMGYPCSLICRAGTYSFSDIAYPIIDTSEMPEDVYYAGNYIFYYPVDAGYCTTAPAYETVYPSYVTALGWVIETKKYKLGIGKTYFHHADGEPVYETDQIAYFNIRGISCGTPFPSNVVKIGSSSFQLFPNPATNELTITTGNTGPYTITFANFTGQTVKTIHTNVAQETISTADLPTGVYILGIADESGNRHNEKVVIMH